MPLRPRRSGALLLALACLAACSRRLDPARHAGALFANLHRAGAVELRTEPALRGAAIDAAERWRLLGFDVALAAPGAAGDRERARVVVGSLREPEVDELLEPIVTREEAADGAPRVSLVGRPLEPGDVLVAAYADPAREGLPLTVLAALEASSVPPWLGLLRPAWKSRVEVWRHGELVFDARLDGRGHVVAGSARDHRPSRVLQRDEYVSEADPAGAWSALVARDVPQERFRAWLESTLEARKQAAELTGIEARPLAIVADAWVERYAPAQGLAVAHDFARFEPASGELRVLLAPGTPDDGGRVGAEAVLRAGSERSTFDWLAPALALDLAGSWWGRDLDDWCASILLLRERRVEIVELLAPDALERISPHVVLPLRAQLLRFLRAERGAEYVQALARGAATVEPGAGLQQAFDRFANERLRPRLASLLEERARRRGTLFPSTLMQGVALAVPAGQPDLGLGTRAAARALDELVERGADAIELETLAAVQPGPGTGRALDPPWRVGVLAGDARLAAAVGGAHERGLRVLLAPQLLTSPAGTWAGDVTGALLERTEQFFDAYEHFLVHHALLAELCGAEMLLIGRNLAAVATESAGDRGSRAEVEPIYLARTQGWERLARAASQSYSGAIGYAGRWPAGTRNFAFHALLDFVGVDFLPSLTGREHGGPRADPRARAALVSALRQMDAFATEIEKPLLLTRTGFRSSVKAHEGGHVGGGGVDLRVQERLLRHLSSALREVRKDLSSLRGLFLLGWSTDPGAGGAGDAGYSLQSKPAEEVLNAFLASE